MTAAVVTGFGSAVPERMDQAGLWNDFFRAHYGGDPVAERIFASSAITMRHGVADPRLIDVSSWTTGRRMARFVDEAPRLGKAAVGNALADADLDPPTSACSPWRPAPATARQASTWSWPATWRWTRPCSA